jgi:hypothetical protein
MAVWAELLYGEPMKHPQSRGRRRYSEHHHQQVLKEALRYRFKKAAKAGDIHTFVQTRRMLDEAI